MIPIEKLLSHGEINNTGKRTGRNSMNIIGCMAGNTGN
jgi:hypothetical protein